MNNERRKAIAAIADQLSELRETIELIRDDEQEAYDNLPESLQYSERGERMQTAIDALTNAASELEYVTSYLSEATE
jgi:hypothetical protein